MQCAAKYHDRAIMACLRKLKIEKNEPLGEIVLDRIDPYFRESWGMAIQLRIELGLSASVPTTPAREPRGGTVGTKARHRILRSGRGARRLNSGEIVGEAINDEG